MPFRKRPLRPRTVLRLAKLWPHARKQGREVGQIYRVGYCCKDCGSNVIWLVDEAGSYNWTADHQFVARFFEVIELSSEMSLYGRKRPRLGPLSPGQRRALALA